MYDIDNIDSEHSHLRAEMRQRRQAIRPEQQLKASLKLCQTILKDLDYRNARHLAFYQAFDGEIDPSPLLNAALEAHKHCYLPVLDRSALSLSFVGYRRDSDLQPNHYGIPEPSSQQQGINLAQLDIIFVPLLAFDSLGTRLGMGKGYYDRALAEFRSSKTHNEKPLLIGLAHECQRVESLERAIWDVPMDRVITDQTVYLVHS
jgi:5-formyltetrahydrofolate cyclo-ligase